VVAVIRADVDAPAFSAPAITDPMKDLGQEQQDDYGNEDNDFHRRTPSWLSWLARLLLPDVDQWNSPRAVVRYRYTDPGGVAPSRSQESSSVKTTGGKQRRAVSLCPYRSDVSTSTRRRTVEYRGDGTWLFGGQERPWNESELIIFEEDLERCTATDLQAALRRSHAAEYQEWEPEAIRISYGDAGDYNEDAIFTHSTSFKLHNGVLTVSISYFDSDDDRDPRQLICGTLEPLLRPNGMTIVSADIPRYGWGLDDHVDVSIGFSTRGRTLRDLDDIGEAAEALIEALDGGELTRLTAGDLIRGAHANVLIGQPEGHWLDVKNQHYDLHRRAGKINLAQSGKIKLAQSVSRFCNSEDGGLVLVGMTTKPIPDGEEIRDLRPVPRNKRMLRLYQQALEDHLHPPPDNLSIEAVDVGDDGMLILIDVPPQPEELKPFLVHGAVVDGKVEGAFISIVRRRGEGSIPITAPMIHSTLAAGRALLRCGELPPDS
jgi:hypothetical protein